MLCRLTPYCPSITVYFNMYAKWLSLTLRRCGVFGATPVCLTRRSYVHENLHPESTQQPSSRTGHSNATGQNLTYHFTRDRLHELLDFAGSQEVRPVQGIAVIAVRDTNCPVEPLLCDNQVLL